MKKFINNNIEVLMVLAMGLIVASLTYAIAL